MSRHKLPIHSPAHGIRITGLLIFVLLFALPAKLPAREVLVPDGCQAVPDWYIVVHQGRAGASVDKWAQKMAMTYGGEIGFVYREALQGFSVRMSGGNAQSIGDEPTVRYVQQDCVVEALATQLDPPNWGLDRIDQRDLPLDDAYTYDVNGAGVHVYIIDSGIRTTHNEFAGRVGNGFDAIGGGVGDCNGHGTHVAGIAAGTTFGVAKGATVHPVRVLGCDGRGTTAGVIAGVDWVTAHHVTPAVANMSLGTPFPNPPVDTAVASSIAAGIAYAIAAGNSSADACSASPAGIGPALTVGSSTIIDSMSSFSNTGPCVDLFAPGSNILSAGHLNDNDTALKSGTSMASPHAAGVAALYLKQNPGASPAAVGAAIVNIATDNRLSGVPTDTVNLLLHSRFSTNEPPVADFTFSCDGLECTFDGRSSTDDDGIVSWHWHFGDGASGSGFVVSHTYAAAGTYQVTLTVTDAGGLTGSRTRSVTVEDTCSDTVRPNVSIISPVEGQFVWGTLLIQASASDNVGVSRVEFRVDGVRRCTDYTAPYGCDINVDGYSTGLHQLRARAFDACDNYQDSTPVNAYFVSDPLANIDAPAEGAVVSGPAAVVSGWATDPDGITSLTVKIDGQAIPSTYGLARQDVCDAVPVSDPNCPNVGFEAIFDTRTYANGPHTLTVTVVNGAGETVESPDPPRSFAIANPCGPDFDTLCLQGGRFEATLTWVDPWTGNGGNGHAFIHPDTDATGYFWFYDPENLEVGVKILDGSTVGSNYFWVFHGAATTLDYELTITDTEEGTARIYQKTGPDPCGGADTAAFPQDTVAPPGGEAMWSGEADRSIDARTEEPDYAADLVKSGSCVPGPQTLCLLDDRFEVKVMYDGEGTDGRELNTQNGDFFFFSPDNREILVKMLDARYYEGYFWMFYASMTDQDHQVIITDTVTGAVRTYTPPDAWCGVIDLQAFQ